MQIGGRYKLRLRYNNALQDGQVGPGRLITFTTVEFNIVGDDTNCSSPNPFNSTNPTSPGNPSGSSPPSGKSSANGLDGIMPNHLVLWSRRSRFSSPPWFNILGNRFFTILCRFRYPQVTRWVGSLYELGNLFRILYISPSFEINERIYGSQNLTRRMLGAILPWQAIA
ncbi:hypothetical protein M422DRAFT_269945 [Sphaerobolus stellatus SS14]|uniref:Uncharacterized protein n=1 Tax=Sphaerobolus stellatus (strain SS14) TaxID=990650 RepID=A0A0C9UU52_SPHS4|nr:hypothetical protein M422DRAFT_269945 [Sphaerobolus stellatus SS14]